MRCSLVYLTLRTSQNNTPLPGKTGRENLFSRQYFSRGLTDVDIW